MNRFYKLIAILMLISFLGCAMGPPLLRSTSSEYNRALQSSADEQLLLNIVRLKYHDTPLFLDIGSISSQFVIGGGASIGGTINENVGQTEGRNPNVLTLGGSLTFQEKPTITLTPLKGEDFVQRMMTPIELDTIMLLYYSGWKVERILRLVVQQLNGVGNAVTASGPTPKNAPEYKRFIRLAQMFQKLQEHDQLNFGYESRKVTISGPIAAGAVTGAAMVEAVNSDLRFQTIDDGRSYILQGTEKVPMIRIASEAEGDPNVKEFLQLLHLNPDQYGFEIKRSLGAPANESGEDLDSIALTTRSFMGLLFYLSQGVQTPAKHAKAGLVTITKKENGALFDWKDVTGDLWMVRSQKDAPEHAAVAIQYRGYWFYIQENDLQSKNTFILLSQLFSLQSGNTQSAAPLLTLPIGN